MKLRISVRVSENWWWRLWYNRPSEEERLEKFTFRAKNLSEKNISKTQKHAESAEELISILHLSWCKILFTICPSNLEDKEL